MRFVGNREEAKAQPALSEQERQEREAKERAIIVQIEKLPFLMRSMNLPQVVDVNLGGARIFTVLGENDFTQQGLSRKFARLTKGQAHFLLQSAISRKEKEKRNWWPLYTICAVALLFYREISQREYVSTEQKYFLPLCALMAYAYWYMTKKEETLPESVVHFKNLVESVVGEFEDLVLPRAEEGALGRIYAVGQVAFRSM